MLPTGRIYTLWEFNYRSHVALIFLQNVLSFVVVLQLQHFSGLCLGFGGSGLSASQPVCVLQFEQLLSHIQV